MILPRASNFHLVFHDLTNLMERMMSSGFMLIDTQIKKETGFQAMMEYNLV